MPQAAVEQVFYRAGGCAASLRGADTPCRNHPGGIPHRPLLPLELWRLSFPNAALAVDRNAVLSDLLYLAQSPAGGSSHGCYTDATQAVRFGPVRRSPDGRCAAESAVHGVRPWLVYVWMVVPFGCMALPLPDALKIWNGQFFGEYPLTLGTLDPGFSMPAAVLIVQCALFAVGIVLLMIRPAHSKR